MSHREDPDDCADSHRHQYQQTADTSELSKYIDREVNSFAAGAVAGIVIGAVALIAFLIVTAPLMLRKQSRPMRRRTTGIPDPMPVTIDGY
ncbi:hypothetical protein PV11_09931 [Exophiala sideris]|uniref:Uncharacterized protein n=1 Tax=Exophiala sideris TaxID=1016849 RepID=A0A0D1WSW7_9EURO|nr:hypothetical protein PV11_09931 [Exophiala sideris]